MSEKHSVVTKLYADRNACELDKKGNYFLRHLSAMTSEDLHSKAAIACELGYRDMLIHELKQKQLELLDEVDRRLNSIWKSHDEYTLEYYEAGKADEIIIELKQRIGDV